MLLALALSAAAAQLTQCAPEACTGAGVAACPAPRGLASQEPNNLVQLPQKIFFRNEASHAAEVLHVGPDGAERTYGLLAAGMRRSLPTLQGDVWRARAVRPGHRGDGALMLEEQIGNVVIRNCDCPQPAFKDCSAPRTRRDDAAVSDPVVFDNRAGAPVDLFWWNGTCEQLVSWDEIGGVQPMLSKRILSTHGHTFRLRGVGSRRFLMAHTLSDHVLRSCDEDERAAARGGGLADGLAALRAETNHFEHETRRLRERLAAELARLVGAIDASNATAPAARVPTVGVAVQPGGRVLGAYVGAK